METVRTNNKITPSFHYLPEETEKNIKLFNSFLDNDVDIFYAIKANNYAPLVRRLIQSGYGFDIASKEELAFVLHLGASPEKICFSAPTKLVEDLKYASKKGVKYYAFDSEEEIKKIIKYTKNPLLFARIATKNQDATFNLSDKFGMTETYYNYIVKKAKSKKWPIFGLTFHVGSQNRSINSWRNALDHITKLVDITRRSGLNIQCINLGGGIPVQYENGVKSREYYIQSINKQVRTLRKKTGIQKIFVEPGRALAANTMYLLTKVINIKNYKNPPIIITDASVFNGLIEPLEHFEYSVYKFGKLNNRVENKYFKVGGISCDGYDIIKKRCLLPANIKVGDLLVIPHAGAYSFVYENFHMRKFPDIVCE